MCEVLCFVKSSFKHTREECKSKRAYVYYYVFGQEPAIAMHLALWYVVLVCHQYDVCENYVGSVYVGGMVV